MPETSGEGTIAKIGVCEKKRFSLIGSRFFYKMIILYLNHSIISPIPYAIREIEGWQRNISNELSNIKER